ncbi:MAG: hypothetical protein ABH823_03905, partial [bacterium]
MAFFIGLNSAGGRNIRQIRHLLEQYGASGLRRLQNGSTIEIAYDKIRSRFNQQAKLSFDAHLTLDQELHALGVELIYRHNLPDEADPNRVEFINGPLDAVNKIFDHVKNLRPEDQVTALLHIIQNWYFPGMPQENIDQLENQIAKIAGQEASPIAIKVMATGIAAARGIAATGNLGAVTASQLFSRLLNAQVAILNGGHGTRLFGLRKLKGDVLFGQMNLTIWNIISALYFRTQMPKLNGYDYCITMANDGILIPFGRLTADGRLLSEHGTITKSDLAFLDARAETVWQACLRNRYFNAEERDGQLIGVMRFRFGRNVASADKLILTDKHGAEITFSDEERARLFDIFKSAGVARRGYFFAAPDNPATMSPEETERFGMIALKSDGTFICATEKLGRAITQAMAKQELADRGESAHEDEIRLYVNYFGMATTEPLEASLREVLTTIIRPDLTADETAALDTYSILFAAISSNDAADFRKKIEGMQINHLLVESQIDNKFFAKLRQALFRPLRLNERYLTPVERDQVVQAAIDAGLINDEMEILPAFYRLNHWSEIKIDTLTDLQKEHLYLAMEKAPQVLRFGFAEFNRGGIALDIGTLESLFGFYMDLSRNYEATGETRDKLLQRLHGLQDRGAVAQLDQAEIQALDDELRNGERVVRHVSQRIAGLDPSLYIERCEIQPVTDEKRAAIIGVCTDFYTPDGKLISSNLPDNEFKGYSDIIRANLMPQLWEYRRVDNGDESYSYISVKHDPKKLPETKRGELLFFYDPEGIKTVKIAGCRIHSGAIIGRNLTAINSELGSGSGPVIIAENGAVVCSKVHVSIQHEPIEPFSDTRLAREVQKIIDGRAQEYRMEIEGGWEAVVTLEKT